MAGCATDYEHLSGPLHRFPTQGEVNQYYANGGPSTYAQAYISAYDATHPTLETVVDAINNQTQAINKQTEAIDYAAIQGRP
jgi:hypothetical protein